MMQTTVMYDTNGTIVGASYGPGAVALDTDDPNEQARQLQTVEVDCPDLTTNLDAAQRFERLNELIGIHAVDVSAHLPRLVAKSER